MISGLLLISTALTARNTKNLRFFKCGCRKNEHSSVNSMIFADLRFSIYCGISNEKLVKKDGMCIRPRVVPSISVAPIEIRNI